MIQGSKNKTSITLNKDMVEILHCERIVIMLLVTCIFISLIIVPAAAIERHYIWEVTYQYKSLDCYKKLAIAINEIGRAHV